MDDSIKKILKVGTLIKQALDANDIDSFYNLVDKREEFINELKASGYKSTDMSASDTQAIEQQFQEIVEAMNSKEEEMLQQLQQLDQFKRADRSYNTGHQRRQFITKKLLG
ncbi:MAG: hypothetical protein AB8G77_27935 [Rhodothermales bacterium]